MDPGATYDVAQGSLEQLRASAGDYTQAVESCLADDITATSLSWDGASASGGVSFFLVRPAGCGGEGTYDALGPFQVRPRDPGAGSRCP